MSKRSLFWGQASGKLGEAVFYRAGGEQRTRAWVAKIKNPRTRAQAITRATMANLTNFYRANASLLRDSFTNKPQNQSGFNAFVQKSKNRDTGVVGEQGRRLGMSFPHGFCVADGTAVFAPNPSAVVVVQDGTPQLAGLSLFSWKSAFYSDPQGEAITDALGLRRILVDFLWNHEGWWDGLPLKFSIYVVNCDFIVDGYRSKHKRIEIDGTAIQSYDTVEDIEAGLHVSGDFNNMLLKGTSLGFVTDNNGMSHLVTCYANSTSEVNTMMAFGGAFVAYKPAGGSIVTSQAYLSFTSYGASNGERGLVPYLAGGQEYENMVLALTGTQASLV